MKLYKGIGMNNLFPLLSSPEPHTQTKILINQNGLFDVRLLRSRRKPQLYVVIKMLSTCRQGNGLHKWAYTEEGFKNSTSPKAIGFLQWRSKLSLTSKQFLLLQQ